MTRMEYPLLIPSHMYDLWKSAASGYARITISHRIEIRSATKIITTEVRHGH